MGIFPHSCYLVRFTDVGDWPRALPSYGELRYSCTIKVQATYRTILPQKTGFNNFKTSGWVCTAIAPFAEYLHIIIVRYAAAALATNPEKS